MEVQSLRFSQVKPLQEASAGTLAAIESFLSQAGVADHDVYLCSNQNKPEGWLTRHPSVTWLQMASDQSQNGKAATLAQAARYWSGDIFVVTDADMWAPPGYLQRVLAPFEDPKVGVVTCLYRSTAPRYGDFCHLFESLCILDFSISVLVARRTEGITFAMGSTMAIRREALEQIGGFAALTPYLADDYQLGHRAHKAGWKIWLADTLLQTEPPRGKLEKALAHQYRWLVTSRISRPGGHFAFIVTQGFLWASLLLVLEPALGALAVAGWCALRILCGAFAHLQLGGSPASLWQVFFMPWKDVLYLGLWTASLWGQTVRWGDRAITIDGQGRIVG